jgi:transposase
MNPTIYIGCDAHKSACNFCAIDKDGETVWEGKRPTNRKGFANLKEKFTGYEIRMAIEAWGFIWTLTDMLTEIECARGVWDPGTNRHIGNSRKKTDKVDAKKLAHLLQCGYLNIIHVPTKYQRKVRTLTRERFGLVRTRSKWLNQIKTAESDEQVERRKRLIAVLNEEIKPLDRPIKEMAEADEDAKLLMTMPGFAYFSSLAIIGEIGTMDNFPSCGQYEAYCGLVPSVNQSGKRTHMGRVRKDSNSMLSWIYTEAAWHNVRRPGTLASFFQKKAEQKGKCKAIVAVARKLSSYHYQMLKNRWTYDELVTAIRYIG